MATLPPWLDVTPQTWAGTAEAGMRGGLQYGEEQMRDQEFQQNLGLQRAKLAQDAAQTAQEMQMKQLDMKVKLAEFMNNLKQQNLENTMKQEKQQHDMNMAEQEQALKKETLRQTMDWRNTQAKTQQDRWQMQADVSARKFQAQQEAMRRIHAGEDPAKVLLDLGAALGESASGLASLWKETQPGQERPDVSQGPPMITRDGRTFYGNYDDKGNFRWTEARSQGSNIDDKYIGHLANILKVLQGNPRSITPGTPENAKYQQYLALYDKALQGAASGAGGGAATAPAGASGPAGIKGASQFTPTVPFTESSDYQAPGYQDEEGTTEAPAWQPAQPEMPAGPTRIPYGNPLRPLY